ncbi:MAG: type II toxin-antitoxin system HicA family toxin [Desulfatiglandaceae bacterium]
MNKKQRKTLEKILELPTRADISWPDVQSMFGALGAEIREGNGSRVRVVLRNHILNMHKPHPRKELGKYAVELVRDFLKIAGVGHDEKHP